MTTYGSKNIVLSPVLNHVRQETLDEEEAFSCLDSAIVVGGGIRLSQVSSSLISNSLKFTPSEGSIMRRIKRSNSRSGITKLPASEDETFTTIIDDDKMPVLLRSK